ncbi:AAA family ATPase [Pseudomonadota bacterium]|nr:AAA family ATPase [Pseudomonadota bacterium]
MQLKHIKLAGFKSFVDPTRISFPTNMVAVVGPNGCGKSNVIDAVRWVLGELSAKNLRGESMSDVIFNGSDLRKPSGQCSIELLFDNSMGKLGGEYAKYNEISIKRMMTRDGQSHYSMNNTRCRRKDVQDIFLGTGLGPRSYAIIEQGMVSKIVSAKPEEMRVFIEEAAGISKYKERRKETEQRIKKTKENLSRVKDIRDEIQRLINRLQNQAKAAEKYKKLQVEEKELKLKISILNTLSAKAKKDSLSSKISQLSNQVSVKSAEVNTHQASIDQIKTEHASVLSAFEVAQKNFYTIGSEIARYETNLQNINKAILGYEEGLSRAKDRYAEALDNESSIENLSPKEKAMKLLDAISEGLKDFGPSADSILSKAAELKDLLTSILKITSAQSKNITNEYLLRQNEISEQLGQAKENKLKAENDLSVLVGKSSTAESELNSIRQKQSVVDASIQDVENKKSIAALDLRSLEEKLNNLKLDLRTFEVNLDNASETLKKAGISIADLNPGDYEAMDLSDLESSLASTQSSIISLGAINLAAPDEIAEESKRIDELDSQLQDLNEALDKLQSAIKKIDVESKMKFDESFNAVNSKIKEIFPKLFGGGKAALQLIDGDSFNSGITLAAQPPGKKNATISQLSGGEKAMTALSLVFALFELNPAPFCMLDEVDAPLDDINATRFVAMVEEMSDRVQFIFITHNKISMEKSDHLMGVTMQEAGVSRVVSVDVKEALKLAAS